jgi:cytolysin (calcineurin-like family phosphatase)
MGSIINQANQGRQKVVVLQVTGEETLSVEAAGNQVRLYDILITWDAGGVVAPHLVSIEDQADVELMVFNITNGVAGQLAHNLAYPIRSDGLQVVGEHNDIGGVYVSLSYQVVFEGAPAV